jgi:hypothetical protein
MVDREELARCCLEVEQAGGNVLTFLKECGYVSTWGTWYRLQIEELGRKKDTVTGGRGENTMNRITLEQKKKAVQIGIDGGDVIGFLKKCGSKNPSAHWCVIKKNLKDADPEAWAKLEASAKKDSVQTEKPVTCCAPSTREGVEVPEDVPEIPAKEPMTTEEAFNSLADGLAKITRPTILENFDVMALRSVGTGFRFTYEFGLMTWKTPGGDEVSFTPETWRALVDELPRVMKIFGI